jgi:hypothetical protein
MNIVKIKMIIAATLSLLSFTTFASETPPRKVIHCDGGAMQAASAGYFKSKGKTLDETLKSFADAIAGDAEVNDDFVSDTVNIIHWAYDQDESGNYALGKKYFDLCTGKAKEAEEGKDPLDQQEKKLNSNPSKL